MIFLQSFLSGETNSVACTPTGIDTVNKIVMSGAWFNDIRVTYDLTETTYEDIYDEWNYDTVMHAKFEEDTHAGNVEWDLDSLSYILIKRKKSTDYKWTTIAYKDVQSIDDVSDYNLVGTDVTAAVGYEYQYAAVAIIDNVENEYSIDTVDVTSKGILIADATAAYYTWITDHFLDNVSVTPNSIVDTMYDKYPTIVRNTLANYEQVTLTAEFVPYEENECDINYDDIITRMAYNKEVKLFLRNGYTKILKGTDGQIWMGYVTDPPSDSADTYYYIRKVTFTLTETGNPDSEKYLYRAGIIDVPENFWSYDN